MAMTDGTIDKVEFESRDQVLETLSKKRDLAGADLSGLDLSGMKLFGVKMTGADLRDADLTGSILAGADISGADLKPLVHCLRRLVGCPCCSQASSS